MEEFDSDMFRLSSPSDMLAAVPHLLGFYPTESLVLLALRTVESTLYIGSTWRFDLPCSAHSREFAELLLAGPLVPEETEAVFAVIVTDKPEIHSCESHHGYPGVNQVSTEDLGALPHAALAAALCESLQQCGIVVEQALWTPEIRAEAPWKCYHDQNHSGTVADPMSSPLAAALAVHGSVTFRSKDEMRELVAPESDEAVASWVAKLDLLHQEAANYDDHDLLTRDLQVVFDAINSIDNGEELTDDDLVRVLFAVSDKKVRDVSLGTALGGTARSAERLWLSLVRKAPAPEVADVAALLAYSAYMLGNETLAVIALERVIQSDPDHVLGRLLAFAIFAGISPDELADIVRG
ncbi:DUF4192 domain-containing protein [Saccharopolyspora elongata]|uniref:DUF4192 domain-containing protein n=1 Tax=Saccharopolyspora elongata TaxID=2530387 RepID=A0A4R4XVR3_9PSEU|nr:DUF4192 domain-containing protein [Saccharopolyspora elongata]TDD35493.1 DUF4192 domain-containing protein [Saccharopolyspora elongata]